MKDSATRPVADYFACFEQGHIRRCIQSSFFHIVWRSLSRPAERHQSRRLRGCSKFAGAIDLGMTEKQVNEIYAELIGENANKVYMTTDWENGRAIGENRYRSGPPKLYEANMVEYFDLCHKTTHCAPATLFSERVKTDRYFVWEQHFIGPTSMISWQSVDVIVLYDKKTHRVVGIINTAW